MAQQQQQQQQQQQYPDSIFMDRAFFAGMSDGDASVVAQLLMRENFKWISIDEADGGVGTRTHFGDIDAGRRLLALALCDGNLVMTYESAGHFECASIRSIEIPQDVDASWIFVRQHDE
jgi:hypothetical protein